MIGETMANFEETIKEKLVFRRITEKNILKCAEWLRDNVADLANRFAGGCTKWSIEFKSDATDGMNVVLVNIHNSRSELVRFDAITDETNDSEQFFLCVKCNELSEIRTCSGKNDR